MMKRPWCRVHGPHRGWDGEALAAEDAVIDLPMEHHVGMGVDKPSRVGIEPTGLW